VNYLLHIDTAVVSASICLSQDEAILGEAINPTQKDHAAWIHNAIKDLLLAAGISLQQLSAISISAGPGSYTGLRVGMSTAKGLCYALKKPLVLVSTLEMMAFAAGPAHGALLCPMIDARRLEVFTAVYREDGTTVLAPANMIIDENSFGALLHHERVIFFGNGSNKSLQIINSPNAEHREVDATAKHMVPLAFRKFGSNDFADLAYAEPYYGKAFHSSIVKRSI
jgi:tRNA threonylcarbamoyladenosine biosynthesis protein TsaB